MMTSAAFRLARVLGLALAAAALVAAIPSGPVPTPEEAAAPRIEQTASLADDALIAERIRGIFAAIEGLDKVTVRTAAGVVTLSGTVTDPDARQRA